MHPRERDEKGDNSESPAYVEKFETFYHFLNNEIHSGRLQAEETNAPEDIALLEAYSMLINVIAAENKQLKIEYGVNGERFRPIHLPQGTTHFTEIQPFGNLSIIRPNSYEAHLLLAQTPTRKDKTVAFPLEKLYLHINKIDSSRTQVSSNFNTEIQKGVSDLLEENITLDEAIVKSLALSMSAIIQSYAHNQTRFLLERRTSLIDRTRLLVPLMDLLKVDPLRGGLTDVQFDRLSEFYIRQRTY